MIEECFFKQHPRAKNLTDDGNEGKERIVGKVLFKDAQTMLIFYQAIMSYKELCGAISKQCASCSQAA